MKPGGLGSLPDQQYRSPQPSTVNRAPAPKKLTREKLRERSAKGLCWHYDKLWSRKHRCKKGRLLVIEPVEEVMEPSEESLGHKEEDAEEEPQPTDFTRNSPLHLGFEGSTPGFAISTCTARYGRNIPVRQVTSMRTARYRAVPSKIDRLNSRLKKKSTVGGRLRKKKKRRRGKEKQ
ncbi:hypothetical protein BHE74_00017129 [Ensete ventricosum]|nr:hypothetical protein BHE74_00017129 [Ensete ventricosum]